jgi:hypothetical protein
MYVLHTSGRAPTRSSSPPPECVDDSGWFFWSAPIRGSPARLGESSAMVFPVAASMRSGAQMVMFVAVLLTARR